MHATVALGRDAGDARISTRSARGRARRSSSTWCRDPAAFPRADSGHRRQVDGRVADDRSHAVAASRPAGSCADKFNWPLEPECGWGPPPVATILTSRVCPWQCVFCNENSLHPQHGPPPGGCRDRRAELSRQASTASARWSSTTRCSSRTRAGWKNGWRSIRARPTSVWPYWAAARSDTVRQWPDLFEALVSETNWNTISIGFESGSDRILKLLNKECTEEDNYFAIDLLNRIGDDMERAGPGAAALLGQHHAGHPGRDAAKTPSRPCACSSA